MEQEYEYMVCVRCFTYNHAKYIEDAMNGFAMQKTDFPFACVIVDDASTDGEQEVILQWAGMHLMLHEENIAYHKKMSYGELYFARCKENTNAHFAILLLRENHYQAGKHIIKFNYIAEWLDTSKYQALCEGDDYWTDPYKLQKQINFLESHPDYGMCHTDFRTTGRQRLIPVRTENSDNYWPSILTKGLRIGTLTVIVREDIYKNIPRLNIGKEWPIGDLPMWYEIARVSKIKYLPDVTATYRVLTESASHSNKLEKVLNYEGKKLEMKRFYAKTYNVEVDERLWETQSYEIIIRFAARNNMKEVAEKYHAEAKKKNIVSRKLQLYYLATKCSVINWMLRKVHLL